MKKVGRGGGKLGVNPNKEKGGEIYIFARPQLTQIIGEIPGSIFGHRHPNAKKEKGSRKKFRRTKMAITP